MTSSPAKAASSSSAADAATTDDEEPATSRSPQTPTTARANAQRIATWIDEVLTRARGDKEASYQDVTSVARAALSANRQFAQLTGEWGASESAVASSPHFKRLLNVIMGALRGDGLAAARRAVLDALEREERGGKQAEAA